MSAHSDSTEELLDAESAYAISSHQKLLHELQVHQVELEMQNQELLAAKHDLDESLARYADLYDHAPVAYFTLSPAGDILTLNHAGAALLGVAGRSLLSGRNLRDFVALESRPTWRAFLARVFAESVRQIAEIGITSADRTRVVRLEAVAGEQRRECRLAAIDITEHRRNAAVRQSEQRFSVALADSQVTVFEQDLSHRYTWMHNPMLGLAADDAIGRSNGELMTAESALQLDALVGEVIASARSIRSEVTVAIAERGAVDWDLSLDPRYDEAGSLIGVIGAATDVTERKRTERALRAAKLEAERADNAKSRFLAAASHDLRQPLGALALYVGVLRNKVAPADHELVEQIRGCVGSMTVLLNDLLDVSKLTAGVVKPQLTDFPVDDMLAHLVTVHAPAAAAKGIHMRQVPSGLRARTDRVWFGRMIGNLIANAVEFTARGGVLVACRRRQGKTWIEIRDTGIGIPADKTTEIFEEFRQLGDPARNRGSGLGLAIVARTAALLGLEIRVVSHPGRGSLFAVELPLSAARSERPAKAAAPAATARLSIALVEDNLEVREALRYALTSTGHRVVAAASQWELLESLAGVAPDIVVADYRLADNATGLEAVRAVRRAFGDKLPAVILTGDTDPAIMAEMSRHGILIEHKPIEIDALEACIAKAMKQTQRD